MGELDKVSKMLGRLEALADVAKEQNAISKKQNDKQSVMLRQLDTTIGAIRVNLETTTERIDYELGIIKASQKKNKKQLKETSENIENTQDVAKHNRYGLYGLAGATGVLIVKDIPAVIDVVITLIGGIMTRVL